MIKAHYFDAADGRDPGPMVAVVTTCVCSLVLRQWPVLRVSSSRCIVGRSSGAGTPGPGIISRPAPLTGLPGPHTAKALTNTVNNQLGHKPEQVSGQTDLEIQSTTLINRMSVPLL